MRKSSIAIVMALASIGAASEAWKGYSRALKSKAYPVSNRHTGKAAERRDAKRRRRANK